MISIDKNIPLPTKQQNNRKYPFREMDIDDSFFIEALTEEEKNRVKCTVMSSVASYNRTPSNKKIKLSSRWLENGVRFWRIK